ncbi:TPA: hypothetical protein ACIAPS_004606 [Salmonella enterica subsp. enterica serovar Bovismorbificans]
MQGSPGLNKKLLARRVAGLMVTVMVSGSAFAAAQEDAPRLLREAGHQFQQQEQQRQALLTPEAPDVRLSDGASSPSRLVFPAEKPRFVIRSITLTGQDASRYRALRAFRAGPISVYRHASPHTRRGCGSRWKRTVQRRHVTVILTNSWNAGRPSGVR